MRKEFLLPPMSGIKTSFPRGVGIILVLLLSTIISTAQQNIISQKDNTRPEATAYTHQPSFVTSFTANKWNGYNEIRWSAAYQGDTKRYIIEYSVDGLNYQSVGEMVASPNPDYVLQHRILENRPMLYRIRSEQLNEKSFYSSSIVLDGVPVSPVIIYPTVITSNTVNVNASWPVERITVTSSNGSQVMAKDINGQRDFMAISVPAALSRGMYYMTFQGKGWKTTEKFVVQ
ncbi:MAG TPA: T9SS type A sorting domain-containing protein [Chitinophagaceae bacterium]|jgi:hypothetical protein|nr:T9SS type A sorting domain-containing protein [Chitinophagaceae bacterium]